MTQPTTKEVLIAARALIEKPENWCSHGWGHDNQRCGVRAVAIINGRALYPDCDEAPEIVGSIAENHLHDSVGEYFGNFNDTHTHAEVLAAFDKAIAECAQ